MTDISDLEGVIPNSIRWNSEIGALGRSVYDPATGERTIEEIELGSSQAKFVMDMARRERGYGLIRKGVFDVRTTPVGTAPPEWPGEDYKPAVVCNLWNPPFGELRLVTNATLLRDQILALWDRCRRFKQFAEGLLPVIHFVDRYEVYVKAVDRTFWAVVIHIIGWWPRDNVPSFAPRPPTIKPWPPLAIDNQVDFAQLEAPRQGPSTDAQQRLAGKLATGQGGATAAGSKRVRGAPKQGESKQSEPLERGSLNDFLDDEIQDDPIPEL
jgi:hypothetical protein